MKPTYSLSTTPAEIIRLVAIALARAAWDVSAPNLKRPIVAPSTSPTAADEAYFGRLFEIECGCAYSEREWLLFLAGYAEAIEHSGPTWNAYQPLDRCSECGAVLTEAYAAPCDCPVAECGADGCSGCGYCDEA